MAPKIAFKELTGDELEVACGGGYVYRETLETLETPEPPEDVGGDAETRDGFLKSMRVRCAISDFRFDGYNRARGI
jgi:hypothetical protein